MKIDYDFKKPFNSVKLIPEEEEYLTEKQTEQFRKIGLNCVRISYFCIFFAIVAFLCNFVDLYNIKETKVLAIIGYTGLFCLLISLALLFIEYRKLEKLQKEFDENSKNN